MYNINNNMRIDKNYIVWALISIPILVGIFLIVRWEIVPTAPISAQDDKLQSGQTLVTKLPTPKIVKGVYLTSTSGGNAKKIDWLVDLANKSELNSVIVDIKDFSGYIAYDSGVADAEKYSTERHDIKDIDALIKRLHDNNIYIIARMTVFQDPALVRARPDWAVQNRYTKRPWQDRKGLSWIDPTCRECWGYYTAIAKDALDRGVDEINFDYIRFPSDGDMSAIVYSPRDGSGEYTHATVVRPKVLNDFFKYMRSAVGDAKMSADLFGFVTTRTEDFGVGQVMEDAFEHFDYISPMVYPSHYPPNFLGFANPAEHPYEVVYHAMKGGMDRLRAYKEKNPGNKAEFRPWIQDFKMGAVYTPAMVESEIKATQDALGENYTGYMLWNAGNNYSESVLYK